MNEQILSDREIIRNIAKTFVYKKEAIINLLLKYGVKLDEEPTNEELIHPIIKLFETNPNFITDYTKLMIKDKKYSSFDPITLIIAGVTAIGSIFAGAGKKKEDNTDLLIHDILELEKQKQQKKSSGEYFIIGGLLLGAFIISGIVIYQRIKK